jgi:hypothetical protein
MPIIRAAISLDGPVIDLGVQIARAEARALIARGPVPPPPVIVRALIDTGADLSAVHPLLLAQISNMVAGTLQVRRPGTGQGFSTVNRHKVRLAFGGFRRTRTNWIAITAAAIAPSSPGVMALIGRDMLAHCQFVYDGFRDELLLVH